MSEQLPLFEQSEFEYITRLNVPNVGKAAVQKWITEHHVELENKDTQIEYIALPTESSSQPFLALFSGKFNYDYRLQVFVLCGCFEGDKWHVARVHEWFVAAMSGEVNRVVRIMKEKYPARYSGGE